MKREADGDRYFKAVDRHNDWTVSAFLAGSGAFPFPPSVPRSRPRLMDTVKFVLLHDIKNDDGIRLFFLDLWEAYIKVGSSSSGVEHS